jgi:hypothetical protein
MNENYFMGLDGFVWFVGVVENRNDPAKLGRVQVRCLGYHTETLEDLASEDLPWAHVMMPTTDTSMQGLGTSPSFLVEGTWVVGFFRDTNEKQQPIIMGSLPGYPASTAADNVKATKATNKYTVDGLEITETTLTEEKPQKGFQDPNGKYPASKISHSNHSINESDVSRLARGEDAETHKLLEERRAGKITGVVTAVKPDLTGTSTQLTSEETRGSFDEPEPRGVEDTGTSTGQYPFNHVYESESGHVSEIDDTPGGERLLRQHKSGTFEEITNDGRTLKVKGKNYEMVIGDSNIFIQGNVNMTTYGNKREFVSGDYVLEVGGNFTRRIGANEQVKIGAVTGGNLEEVILGSHGYNISGAVKGSIGTDDSLQSRDFDLNVGGNFGTNVGADHFITSGGNMTLTSGKTLAAIALENIGLTSIEKMSITSGTAMSVKSATTINIKSEAVGTMVFAGSGSTINLSGSGSTITTTQEVTANTITLTGHVHSQTVDSAGDIQVNTSAPVA